MPEVSILHPLPPPDTPGPHLASHAVWQRPEDVMASIARDIAIEVVGESGAGGAGLACTKVVTADGTSTALTVMHNLATANIVLVTYNDDTGEKIAFAETVKLADRVILTAADYIEAGLRVRVVMLASGGTEQGQTPEPTPECIYEPETAIADWNINHGLDCIRPHIVIEDENGNEIHGAPNRRTATANYLQIQFSAPQRGKAYLTKL